MKVLLANTPQLISAHESIKKKKKEFSISPFTSECHLEFTSLKIYIFARLEFQF